MAESLLRANSVDDTEEEVFEITDFTTVSDWEKFIAQISEAISDWQLTCIEHVRPLTKSELTMGTWEQIGKEIRFSNAIFMLTLYRFQQSGGEEVYLEEPDTSLEDELHLPAYMDDMMSTNNDFPPRAHCLVRWYGFRSFLVLSLKSTGGSTSDGLTSESKCNSLLSSACIVLSDSGCEVPIFMQIQQNWRKMYTGRCMGTGMQTEFDMVHLKKCPPQYQHLSGLLHVFKSKIGRTISPVQVSARFTYVLSNWGDKGTWPKEQVDPDIAAQTLDSFLFGCLDDPIGDLQLSAVWPSITEDLIFENDVHSDFNNPTSAPVWAIRLHYTDNPECLLSSYLKDIIKLRNSTESFTSLTTSPIKSQNNEQDIGQVFSKLTDSSHKVPLMPELTSGLSKISSHTSIWASKFRYSTYPTGPISISMMELIMGFLLAENLEKKDEISHEIDEATQKGTFVHELEHQLKSAPKNSLTYKFAICVTVVNFCHGGVAAIAQVWHEFVQEMRYRFENAVLIPGINTENPDLRCCLLHQKLQMLNCCIKHKLEREKNQSSRNQKSTLGTNKVKEKLTGKSSMDGVDILDSHSDENVQSNEVSSVESALEDNVELVSGKEMDQSPEEQSHVMAESDVSVCQIKEDTEASTSQSIEVNLPPVKETATSIVRQKSSGWQEDVSSIDDDEFFECDDGEQDLLLEQDENPTDKDEQDPGYQIKEVGSLDARDTTDGSLDDRDTNDENEEVLEMNNGDLLIPDNQAEKEPLISVSLENTTDKNNESNDSTKDNADKEHTDSIPTDKMAKAVGRLKPFGHDKLLHHDALLYIPVTQEPAPLTEDALEEQTKIFSSLGDSAEGAVLRRKMQSASLLSDMESFKAANPGCTLEDFVRWYSPRDYEEIKTENGKIIGSLSDRMKIPGNLWISMWKTAKPVSARRQKRLFDDTKEGEKVLHFLTSLQPKDLAMLLLPMCYHEAITILRSKSDSSIPSVPKLCDQILSQSCKLFQTNFTDKWAEMDDVFQKIQFTETFIERAMSLKHKFAKIKDCDAFVRQLLEHPEVALDGAADGDVGKVVKQYFFDQSTANMLQYVQSEEAPKSQSISLPRPSGREYILRGTAPRPSAQSRPLPHRLYAVLIKNEFRLASAFSSDTVFF